MQASFKRITDHDTLLIFCLFIHIMKSWSRQIGFYVIHPEFRNIVDFFDDFGKDWDILKILSFVVKLWDVISKVRCKLWRREWYILESIFSCIKNDWHQVWFAAISQILNQYFPILFTFKKWQISSVVCGNFSSSDFHTPSLPTCPIYPATNLKSSQTMLIFNRFAKGRFRQTLTM